MPRPPVRQGTSRVVPVVVSAGLAVGVFCGLLFGLGTGKRDATAGPTKVSNGVKRVDDTPPEPPPTPPSATAGSAAAVATAGSGAGSSGAAAGGAGTGAGSAEPEPEITKLIVEIKPDTAAQGAKVYLDGKEILGTSTEVPLPPGTTKQKVKVAVKAAGYRDVEQEVELDGESMTLKFDLSKVARVPVVADPPASAGGTGNAGNPSSGNKGNAGGKSNSGKSNGKGKGSGLIDI